MNEIKGSGRNTSEKLYVCDVFVSRFHAYVSILPSSYALVVVDNIMPTETG